MALQLLRITSDEFNPTNKLTPDQIGLIIDEDSKKLYVYRGEETLSLNEFESEALYERILNRFLNSKIFIIFSIASKEEDSDEILQIKRFLRKKLSNGFNYRSTKMLKRIFLLEGFRNRIKMFKNYENAGVWRRKLTNLSNIWKLSIFNVISLLIITIFLSLKVFLDIIPALKNNSISNIDLWAEDLVLILVLSLVLIVAIILVNLAFILFPMKFPINPRDLRAEDKQNKN